MPGNVLILPTPIALIFLFSQGHKHSYNSAYDSQFDFVTSENQPYSKEPFKLLYIYKEGENFRSPKV